MNKAKRKIAKFILLLLLIAIVPPVHKEHVHAYDIGDELGTCPECGAPMEIMRISQPTCEYDGVAYVQTTCGHLHSESITLPALGHDYHADVIQAPGCTTPGLQENVCSRCGDSYRSEIPSLGHEYTSEITVQPTCTDKGVRTFTCIRGDHSYTEEIAATGHDYKTTITKEATCDEDGIKTYKCTICGHTYTEKIPKTGHDYKSEITTKATCEKDGVETFTCANCGDSYTKIIKAKGHDWKEEKKEATCEEDGEIKKTCKTCGKEEIEVIKAPGHKWSEFVVIEEATCDKDGRKEATCSECGKKETQIIPKLGHQYPEEWTIEKEATEEEEGLRTKECSICHNKITETIPKTEKQTSTFESLGNLLIPAVIISAAAGITAFIYKKSKIKKKPKEKINLENPSFEDKTLLMINCPDDVITYMKNRHYLEVTTTSFGEMDDVLKDDIPDIMLAYCKTDEEVNRILEYIRQEGTKLSIVAENGCYDNNRTVLEASKKSKNIIGYCSDKDGNALKLVKLIVPALNPKLNSDESLENIGNLCDLLGIANISTIISLYTSGREIKETLEEDEKGITEYSTIISDLASIFGMDTLSSVTGLIGDLDDIKTSMEEERGANETKNAIEAGKDIKDVVEDISKYFIL